MRAQLALKNTVYLYLRTGIQAVIALFAVRIVLNGLGHVDYGLYNTIASVVVLSSFINSALASATQRYTSYYLGREDYQNLSEVYYLAIRLHRIIALAVFALSEIIGVIFIMHYMNVETLRRPEMLVVLQFSLIAVCLNIVVVPYRSMLTSYERFDILSIVTILEAVLKLGAAYLVLMVADNKLIVYSIAIMVITFVSYAITRYKNRQYVVGLVETSGNDKQMMKEMLSFSGWNFLGGFGYVLVNQFTNMVLNVFCGAVVNAAQAIANQVNTYVSKFVQDFMSAINPQIVKSFSAKDQKYLDGVVYSGIKLSYFLIYSLTVPLIFNLDYILQIWLKNPPEYVSVFVIILLLNSCVLALTGTISTLVEANARIKYTQICYTVVMIVSSAISWYLISKTNNPLYAYYSILLIGIASLAIRLYFARRYKLFRLRTYIKTIVVYILPFTVCYYLVYFIPFHFFHLGGWSALIISCIISLIFLSLFGWFIYLSTGEREMIISIVKRRKQ